MAAPEAVIDIRLHDAPLAYRALEPFPLSAGAECVFLGRTRADHHPRHGELKRLGYEAYRPLAEKTLRDLAEAAVAKFGCRAVRIHHAVGDVPPGQASVLVQVACPHRAEAFDACRFLIDELKATSPIWKRQVWADGATWSQGAAVAPPGGRR